MANDRTMDRTVFKEISQRLFDLVTEYSENPLFEAEAKEVFAFRQFLSFRFNNNEIMVDDSGTDYHVYLRK